MSDREAFEKWYDKTTNCNYGVAYYVDITGRYCHHDIDIAWQAWQAARANGTTVPMTRIAESKVRQLGGDVCGVLVRKDGKLAAVDEHGRVQWLQDGQGADPIGSPGSLQRAKAVFAAYREDFPRFGKRLDGTPAINDLPVRVAKAFSDLCPQPAQQGSVPKGWSLTHIDDPATDGYLIKGPGISYCAWKDKEPWLYLFCEALATTPQPEGDGWIAVPREAVEYLKDQWPGAYARFYEKIDELRRPQPPKESE